MLVQYKDPSLLTRYCPLGKNIQYRVLAISCSLEGDCMKPQALLWDPEAKDSSAGVVWPFFTYFDELEIIDSTTPEDWKSTLLSQDISTPTLVYSFDEMLDVKFYIRVHDIDTERDDLNIVYKYLQKYGGNVILSDEDNTMREESFIKAKDRVEEYLQNILVSRYEDGRFAGQDRDGQYIYDNAEIYFSNLIITTRIMLNKIASLQLENSQRILADKIRSYSHIIDAIERIDEVTLPRGLKEIYADFQYPYDLERIVSKAKERKYLIQHIKRKSN